MLAYRFANENDLWATISALRLSAERFDEYAKVLGPQVGMDQLAKQFTFQAEQARRIATEMEDVVDV